MKNKELLKDLKGYDRFGKDKEISKEISKEIGVSESVFTYGSTPYETASALIKSVNKKPSRFVVVGTSIGWMNFYWNEIYPNIPSLGIDIHYGRIEFGNSLIKKHKLSNIELKVDDLYKFSFKDTDLIWLSNCCFDTNENAKIVNDIIAKNPNVSIISYKPFDSSVRSKVTRHSLPVSWMPLQPFWVYDTK